MNDPSSRPSTSAELIAAEATTFVADEPSAPLPPQNAGTPIVGSAVWTIVGFGVMQVLRFALAVYASSEQGGIGVDPATVQ